MPKELKPIMKKKIKILKSPLLYLTLIAFGFFFLYSAPRINKPAINFSPDENANYFFTRLLAQEGVLQKYEPLNEGIEPIVHPRSINVNANNYLVPGSFLGMIFIYGILAKIFGLGIIFYLTPFFICVSALFFYGIMKKIFSWQVAFIASILMLSHPALWYYATRSMFHNELFLSLLIIGMYFLLNSFPGNSRKGDNKGPGDSLIILIKGLFSTYMPAICAGIFLGLGLTVRPAEAPWVILLLIILWIFYFQRIRFFNVFLIASVAFLLGLPTLSFNQILYQSPVLTGYANLVKVNNLGDLSSAKAKNAVIETIDAKEKGTKMQSWRENTNLNCLSAVFKNGKKLLNENIPKGLAIHFNLRTAYVNFKNYFINFFPWLSRLAFIGCGFFIFFLFFDVIILLSDKIKQPSTNNYPGGKIFAFLRKKINAFKTAITKEVLKRKFLYLLVFIVISCYLAMYYGSWVFHDTPDASLITIGTSYTRYWLPIYIMSLPFIAFFFVKIAELAKYKFPKFVFLFIFCAGIVLYNAFQIYYSPHEGLAEQIEGVNEYSYKKERVMELTEDNALIINQYYDKLFFPERKVIASKMYDDRNIMKFLPILASRAPLYYYSFGLNKDDINFINRKYLAKYGLKLADGKSVYKDEILWKLTFK